MQTGISTDVAQAVQWLRQGHVIGLPTETVYGLAGDLFNPEAVASIFRIKQRPSFNPLIAHLPSPDALEQVAQAIPEVARTLADHFWPGPLTLVLPKQDRIPHSVTAGKPTVAVRVPAHPMALEVLARIEFPLVAPSANPFGSISPTSAPHVAAYFDGQIPMVLDGGPCTRGLESTIVGFPDGGPVVYRLGAVAVESIEAVIGPVLVRDTASSAPDAPGMLLRHYAPRTPLVLTDDAIAAMQAIPKNKRALILHYREKSSIDGAADQIILAPDGELQAAAASLYATLHRIDRQGYDVIIAERFPDTTLGRTINDRLWRAAQSH